MKAVAVFCLWLAMGTAVASADPRLTLEFAQQGDPQNPRALVVIHRGLASRRDLKPFFGQWAGRSWSIRQYCSVYSYSYPAGTDSLLTPEQLASDLVRKIQSQDVERNLSGEDPENPDRPVRPGDARQPAPVLKSVFKPVEFLVLGHGLGGLVAREFVLQGRKAGLAVARVAYTGAPLDGVPLMYLMEALTHPQLAKPMGLSRPLGEFELRRLSPGWLHLAQLRDTGSRWLNRYAEVYAQRNMAAHGRFAQPRLRWENVVYGRDRAVSPDARSEHDGFVCKPSALGIANGPGSTGLMASQKLSSSHDLLLEDAGLYNFVLTHLLEKEILFEYLRRREGIELYFSKGGEDKPIGMYFDERDTPQYKPMWTLPPELYLNMWLK